MASLTNLRQLVADVTRDPNNRDVYGFADYMICDGGKVINKKTGKIIKSYVGKNGYEALKLRNNGIRKHCLVHRILMQSFIGYSDLQVNHKDGNKLNNLLYNLEYCTSSENNLHSYRVLGKKAPLNGLGKLGVLNVNSKAIKQWSVSGNYIKYFDSIQCAERETGINHALICKVLKGKRKTTGGFIRSYAN